jgi:hypothetical protein
MCPSTPLASAHRTAAACATEVLPNKTKYCRMFNFSRPTAIMAFGSDQSRAIAFFRMLILENSSPTLRSNCANDVASNHDNIVSRY